MGDLDEYLAQPHPVRRYMGGSCGPGKIRIFKVNCEGIAPFYCLPGEADSFIEGERRSAEEDKRGFSYGIETIYMTQAQFDSLPEYDP